MTTDAEILSLEAERATLVASLDAILFAMASIRAQIDAAKAHQIMTGEYADPAWFASANAALRFKGREQQQMQMHLGDVGRRLKRARHAATVAASPGTKHGHPMQPIEYDEHGVIRFRENAIVRYLVDKVGLNEIAGIVRFKNEDREQLAQLIGYSVSGFGDLSYAREETIDAADAIAESLFNARVSAAKGNPA